MLWSVVTTAAAAVAAAMVVILVLARARGSMEALTHRITHPAGFECSAVRSSTCTGGLDRGGNELQRGSLGGWREEVDGLAQLAARGVPPVIVASGKYVVECG